MRDASPPSPSCCSSSPPAWRRRCSCFAGGGSGARDSERALGRDVIAEIPAGDDLVLFSEDAARFYYGDRSIDKDLIVAVRVLINGVADRGVRVARGMPRGAARQATSFEDRPEGIARDRWDVAIETRRRHDAGRVRRDPRARVAGAGAGGLRRGQATSSSGGMP